MRQREAAGGVLHGEEEKTFNELECLNLTISVPVLALEGEANRLPVMVYTHGGGFVSGSGHISALHGRFCRDIGRNRF